MNNLADILINSRHAFPDNVALVCEDEIITYKDLDSLAGRFCTHFRAHSVGKNDVVVVVAYKSISVVAALQGAMRADLVYAVIDPRMPAARIVQILADCEARFLIVDDSSRNNWHIFTQTLKDSLKNVIVMDETHSATADKGQHCSWITYQTVKQSNVFDNDFCQYQRRNDDTAYILYTSGSTGIPKGVRISHDNALGFIRWSEKEFGFTSNENLLNHSHLGFDLSVLDLYNGMLAGARVTLIPEYNAVFPAYIADIIEKQKITSVYLVPSFIVSMLNQSDLIKRRLPQLKRILYAGEPFPMEYLRGLFLWCKDIDLYNLYGPIETNVCTFHKITEIPTDAKQVPVGYPIDKTSIAVLGDDGELKVHGPGELCVAGPCVTEGYTNRVDLNESQFIEWNDCRWYRTGDVGEIDQDGVVWCSGRVDHMVKTRGYRVDLQEIESILYQIPFIREAAVVGVPNDITTHDIVAWCVRNDTAGPTDIKPILAESLPNYMIPQSIHWLTELPKSMRGKVDRMKLKKMVQEYGRQLD